MQKNKQTFLDQNVKTPLAIMEFLRFYEEL